MAKRSCWLVKSEEEDYSIRDLAADGSTPWTGVRNYEARNLMRDRMKLGDPVLYYHSNAKPSGVAGVARVASEPYPDPTQFDAASPYFDERASREEPRWFLVDLAFEEAFARVVPLAEIKAHSGLREMTLVKRMRLSVQPVRAREFDLILRLGREG